MRLFWVLLVGVGLIEPVKADWLATVWPTTSDAPHGTPAITLNSDSVAVVLPEAVLAEAQASGLTVEGAVAAFLGRYAPKMCSSLLDTSSVHHQLRVELLLQRPVALDYMDPEMQENAAVALNHELRSPAARSAAVPHLQRAFVVDRRGRSLSIDYVPERKTNCVTPSEAIF